MELPQFHIALCITCRECGRCRCLPDRLGIEVVDPRTLCSGRVSGCECALGPCGQREDDCGSQCNCHLWRRLDRIWRTRCRCDCKRSAVSTGCTLGLTVD